MLYALGTSSILISILPRVITSPTNNIHITLDISLNPSNPLTVSEDACTAEGFYPNTADCAKFYRCVDFGDGSFTRFDFECGPGTVFDPDLVTCNHPWAVSPNSDCYQPETKNAMLETPLNGKPKKQVPLSNSDHAKVNEFECTADGIFADPGDCVTYHECTKQSDGSFVDETEVCGDSETFCPPVGGCGPEAGCPVACTKGKDVLRELK